MSTFTATPNFQKAARAFKLAISVQSDAAKLASEFPKAAGKLQEAAKLLIAAGREAEGKSGQES